MLALAALAWAETPAWRYDLAVQRFIDQQAQAVAESGTLLEDWLSGRLSTARAREKLGHREDVVLAYEDKLRQAPCPRALTGYRQAALARSQAHRRALARIATFLAAEKNDRLSVQRFSLDLSQILSEATQKWLTAREKWLPRLRTGGPIRYYAWQARVLPLQRREARLSGKLQNLVYQGSGREPDLVALQRQGGALVREVAALRREVAALNVSLPSQEAYLEELASLERVAEAVMLMGQDPSPDASSRLKRFSRQLLDRSRAAQEAALKALEAGG